MTDSSTRLAEALADRYRVERELGQGGMATVYLAADLKHDRKVAIKVLKPELAAVLGAERFVVEIKTTAALSHPHILPLLDSGEVDGFLYYVMPYIEGETIREQLNRETQFGIEEALRIATEVADALDYAHRHGVIHRDIKPENILLHDGRPMVMDFGIALAVSAAAGGRMTETGLSLGTPHYMSPEQATADKTITARSDIYSLASVLYEMLAGEPPHSGGSAQAIIMKIIAERPQPLTELRRSVPSNVAAAVAKALEKLPADRFESAKAFAEALTNPGFTVATTGADGWAAAPRTRRAAAGLGILAVVTSALALWGWLRPGPSPVAAHSSWRTTLQLTDTIATVERETFLSMSRDGSLLVFSGGWGASRGLYLRRAGDERATLIRGTEGAFVGAVSPNGKLVAAKGPLGVTVVPVEGGTPRRVMMGELVTPFDWIDDDHLVIDQIDGLYRVPVAGGDLVRLTSVDTAAGEGYHLSPAALPNGAGLVFTVIATTSFDAAEMRIATVGPAGGVHAPLGQGVKAVFTSPGYLLIRTGVGSLDALPFNPVTRQSTGQRQTILSGLTSGIWNNSGEFTVADDGHLVYMTDPFDGDREVVTVNRNGAARPLAPSWIGNFESVSLSPDGQRIAVGTYTTANEEIQVRHVASGATTRISIAGAQLRDPAWAPSGDAVYFSALGTGHNGLYRVGLGAGTVPARVVVERDLVLDQVAPTADGRRIYYTARGVNDIAFRDLAGTDSAGIVLERTSDLEAAPIPSPNGRWLAFWTLETGLMIRSADPARAERIVVYRGAYTLALPRWSRDGSELFFSTTDSLMAVAVGTGGDVTIGTPRALFPLGRLRPHFDVNARGEFIMLRHLVARANPPSLVLVADWKSLLRP